MGTTRGVADTRGTYLATWRKERPASGVIENELFVTLSSDDGGGSRGRARSKGMSGPRRREACVPVPNSAR